MWKVRVRAALPLDYDVYERLFPELAVSEPVLDRARWLDTYAPTTLIADVDGGGSPTLLLPTSR